MPVIVRTMSRRALLAANDEARRLGGEFTFGPRYLAALPDQSFTVRCCPMDDQDYRAGQYFSVSLPCDDGINGATHSAERISMTADSFFSTEDSVHVQ